MKGLHLTKEEFIKQIEDKHGKDRYNFDNIIFTNINDKTPIIIECRKHGNFAILASTIIAANCSRNICPECKREKSFEMFIHTMNKKFLNRFEYDFSTFINSYTQNQIAVYCKEHKIHFKITIATHVSIKTGGCPGCKRDVKLRVFLRKVHNKPYDYSKIDFKDLYTNIKINCALHGEFEQKPLYHLTRHGECPECIKIKKGIEFIKKAKITHKERFNYSKFIYTGAAENGIIICRDHGEFKQTPTLHLSTKTPCPLCREEYGINREDFIKNCIKIYDDQYDYSLVQYNSHLKAVQIICKHHGTFWANPKAFLNNRTGCPQCSKQGKQTSYQETQWLNELNVPKRLFKIDSYIVDGYNEQTNTVYEFLGDYWHGNLQRYTAESINKVNGKSFGELNTLTFERINNMKNKGYNIIYIWESDWINGCPYTLLSKE